MDRKAPFFFDDAHRRCVTLVLRRIVDYYGARLVSLAVFGSYARGQPRLNSDLDLLLILQPGAWSRLSERTEEFDRAVEQHCDRELQELYEKGIAMDLSPIILTRDEAGSFMPIYLDMANDCVIIEDREGFLGEILEKVQEQMARWGSRRLDIGCRWAWEIRPGLKWNEVLRYDHLARAHLEKARIRIKALRFMHQEGGYSDVVREAQECVELLLKGVLRCLGIEVPKIHDVSRLLRQRADLLPAILRDNLDEVSRISRELRKDRELAFYGTDDWIPTEEYSGEDSLEAIRKAERVFEIVSQVIR